MHGRRSPAKEARLTRGVESVVAEALEVRRLYAVTANWSAGTLTIDGTSGADVIKVYKKSADSTVTVYDGTNIVIGSPFSGVTYIVVNANDGNDTVTLGSTAHGTGSDVNSAFDVPISVVAELYGGDGNDTLNATDQNDILEGGAGTDTLNGAAGNDTLTGNDGDDTFNGETGNDYMFASSSTDGNDTFNGGIGADTVDYGAVSAALTLSIDNTANDGVSGETDNVKTDIETLIGGSGNDTITGSANGDTLKGGDGNDTMYGGGGDDDMYGGAGADLMYGDSGNDTFHTKNDGSADTIYGGAGTSDRASDRDVGTDFVMEVEILT
jgi:Ca2+-binding RTX toxin-like protein